MYLLFVVLIPGVFQGLGLGLKMVASSSQLIFNCVKIFQDECVVIRKKTLIKQVKTPGRTGDLTVGNIIF